MGQGHSPSGGSHLWSRGDEKVGAHGHAPLQGHESMARAVEAGFSRADFSEGEQSMPPVPTRGEKSGVRAFHHRQGKHLTVCPHQKTVASGLHYLLDKDINRGYAG
jgi:hypothetical protein